MVPGGRAAIYHFSFSEETEEDLIKATEYPTYPAIIQLKNCKRLILDNFDYAFYMIITQIRGKRLIINYELNGVAYKSKPIQCTRPIDILKCLREGMYADDSMPKRKGTIKSIDIYEPNDLI